jgi:hypothetical protein
MADDIQRSEDLARAIEQVTEALRINNRLVLEQLRATQTSTKALYGLSDAALDAEEAQEKLTGAQLKSAQRFDDASRTGKGALDQLAQGVMGAGKAMLDGKKGAAAMNESLGNLAQAATLAGTALMMLIPGGPIIKGLIAGLTAITAGVTKYAQAANEFSCATEFDVALITLTGELVLFGHSCI